MSWNHAVCEACWIVGPGRVVEEDGTEAVRRPVQVRDSPLLPCCLCLKPTIMGIFIRRSPRETMCQGFGLVHLDED